MPSYNQAGHVCPQTQRIAMTIGDAYSREDSPDRVFFAYYPGEAEHGLDPWRLIEGIDKCDDGQYSIDWVGGLGCSCRADRMIYMQQTKAELSA